MKTWKIVRNGSLLAGRNGKVPARPTTLHRETAAKGENYYRALHGNEAETGRHISNNKTIVALN